MLRSQIQKDRLEAGVDEAGRGCLAGPVVAAAVILPEHFENKILNDSKQLTESSRNELRTIIEESSIAYAVAFVDNEQIDHINILNASILAMHKALDELKKKPEFILVDGNRFKPFGSVPFECFVKGDGRYMSIAAASILAKTYRDEYMQKLHSQFPAYNWKSNKGYPTDEHRAAILKNGITEHHRRSFKLYPDLELFGNEDG